MSEITHLDETYVAHAYARFPVEIVSGKGALALGLAVLAASIAIAVAAKMI